MIRNKIILSFVFILLLFSCNEEVKKDEEIIKKTDPLILSYEVNGNDTIFKVMSFYPSGKKRAITHITREGIKRGYENFFYENGFQKYEIYFIGETIWGVGNGFSIHGKPLDLGTLAYGVGSYNSYFDDGTLQSKGYYRDSKQDSVWYIYYPDGKLEREVNFKLGLQHGLFKRYFKNGNLDYYAEWENGNCLIVKDYYESGNLFRVSNFKNGLMNGESIEYYDDKKKKIRQSRVFVNGKENGIVKHYNLKGNIESIAKMRNGEYVDTCFLFDEKGNVIDMKIVIEKSKHLNI